jgi:hypothetical protein
MMQLSPVRAAASMASTSSPVGVRLTDTSTLSLGMPADTKAALNVSLSGLGFPATRFFNVDSTVEVVAATAGSTVAVTCGLAEGEDEAEGWTVVEAGAAVQAVIVNAAAMISSFPATPTFDASAAALPFACAVRLLIT